MKERIISKVIKKYGFECKRTIVIAKILDIIL